MNWETLSEDVRRLPVPSGWIYEIWCEDRASTAEGYSARQRAAHVFVPFAQQAPRGVDAELAYAIERGARR